jgi:hypothetical protein
MQLPEKYKERLQRFKRSRPFVGKFVEKYKEELQCFE